MGDRYEDMKENLDIMLAARALEDMPANILARLDEKLNPLNEEEMLAQNATMSKRKAKGHVERVKKRTKYII